MAKTIDNDRMKAIIEGIEANYLKLRGEFQDVPIQFYSNIDEMCQTDYGDAPRYTVLVPFNYNKLETWYPVDRNCKRVSVIACILPNGIFCLHQFVIEERCTFDRQIFVYFSEDSLQIVGTNSGFVNSESFLFLPNEMFLPHLRLLRQKHN